ncbi:V-type proton ATPase subunit C 1-B [Psilocybe cubensis]|uniref:V-type proton ATPase subunit C 1-B n=2 Tax=Psilocybe cubensis TaxID=181762 RepID=A0ACB8HHH6_PSICU|nr:V-type proton ATPase subunit C 1-B [Psilocybe cubensis]KAH9487155.1 V-type proton ATPase subunit C 1-B [Psilocybe cubensis]
MPSDQSTWLIAVPQGHDPQATYQKLATKLGQQAKLPSRNIGQLAIPIFKTGTLDSLIALSEDLPKQESFFTATVAKNVETLRNLLNNDPAKLEQHVLVDEQSVDTYLLNGWKWNEDRYDVQKSLRELVNTLHKEMTSIDNAMKAKLNNYNLVKGSLTQMQRKKAGNLSIRSLADVVSKDDFIQDSEYLETLLVAVPKSLTKDWNDKYERLASMVVPRTSTLITTDDEYSLFSVVIFRRVHDEFVQKCREQKFIVRDFVYSEEEIAKQQQELEIAGTTAKELWTELLRLARTNFSESLQILVHLKVIRLFVESVLRYGLPAEYIGFVVKPEPKNVKKVFNILQTQFAYLSSRSSVAQGGKIGGEEFIGEYQTLMDQEFFDFILYEVPWIVT